MCNSKKTNMHLIADHKQKMFWGKNCCGGWHLLVLHKRVIGKDDGTGPSQDKLQNVKTTDPQYIQKSMKQAQPVNVLMIPAVISHLMCRYEPQSCSQCWWPAVRWAERLSSVCWRDRLCSTAEIQGWAGLCRSYCAPYSDHKYEIKNICYYFLFLFT